MRDFIDNYSGIISFIVIMIVFTIIVGFIDYFEKKHDEEIYNNGICTVCDCGKYNFSSASESLNSHSYYYTCDNCGHTIETNELMK